MDKNENQEKKSISFLTKFVVGASSLFGAGVGSLVSDFSYIIGSAASAALGHERYEPTRRFIPRFIPRGSIAGAIVGGGVGYQATVLFGRGYDYAKRTIENIDKKLEQNKPRQ